MKTGMKPRIVIACDSMKGSLTSGQVAEAAAAGIHCVLPEAEVTQVLVADGGEGTVEALVTGLKGEIITKSVRGPIYEPVLANYGIVDDGKTAVIEMATAAGLTLVPEKLRNPAVTTTYGVGELMADALERGCRRFLLCIGGSATNDGAMGLLEALGARFLDGKGNPLPPIGASLAAVECIDLDGLDKRLAECEIQVACDVDNPLYGPRGAAFVFARQKGADDAMIEALDNGLRNYARVIQRTTGRDVATMPGAGAAGGMGGGLVGILDAKLRPGIDMVLDAVRFDNIVEGASLVITGEGRIDSQTLGGKTPMGVLRHSLAKGVPGVALAGSVQDVPALLEAGFTAVLSITSGPCSLEQCMEIETAAANVERTACQIVRLYFH